MNVRKIIKIAALTCIIIIVAVFLLFYRPVSFAGDTHYEPVFTGSMEPTIPVGSIVVIKPTNPETLKIDDIICFKLSQPTTITHRIINITDEGFITKGDANEDPDTWTVKKQNVIGKVTSTIPYIGYIGHFVRTPISFILLIIIPATLLIIQEIRNIIKNTKKSSQKQRTKISEALMKPILYVQKTSKPPKKEATHTFYIIDNNTKYQYKTTASRVL